MFGTTGVGAGARWLAVAALAAGLLSNGCASKKKTATPEDVAARAGAGVDRPPEKATEKPPAAAEAPRPMPAARAPIYFEFDSTLLGPDAREELVRLGELLLARPELSVTIYGHADDRGTDEYNLALGAERAGAARDYLVRLGVSPERIEVVSHGEESPAVAGGGEEAWSKNRRDEFEIVVGTGTSS